ncbi:MAG: hypothetical protein M3131_03505 [Actinomycetota bacterium]|nr:hypothetical protein [Actinomycetota bacterium]
MTEQATKIQQRPDVSPLAFAIADIVQTAASGGIGAPVSLKAVMFGAVLGAYTSLSDVPAVDDPIAATLGAIAGAVATSTSIFITENISGQAWSEYLSMEH